MENCIELESRSGRSLSLRLIHLCAFAPLRFLTPARGILNHYFTHGVTLAYRTYGHGPIAVLAFHGFGRTGEDFAVLTSALGEACTLYAFDLHFHGQSPSYPDRADVPFTPHELAHFFTAFADSIQKDRITLLGYSLGGRIALSLVECMPQRIDRVLLVAPDGLVTRPWYRILATSTFGRALYRRFVEKPILIHGLIDGLRKLRLMNDRRYRFLKGQTDSKRKRILVRDVWLSYRLIEPNLAVVAAKAEEFRIPIHLFFGTHDRVIPPTTGHNLRKFAPDRITQEELPAGHILLTPELGSAIIAHLDMAPLPTA